MYTELPFLNTSHDFFTAYIPRWGGGEREREVIQKGQFSNEVKTATTNRPFVAQDPPPPTIPTSLTPFIYGPGELRAAEIWEVEPSF